VALRSSKLATRGASPLRATVSTVCGAWRSLVSTSSWPGVGRDGRPPADAMIVGGASFNTLNKSALGIADTLALGLLTEGIGLGIPIAALPFVNAAQTKHPAFSRHVEALRTAGVAVLGPGGYHPHPPHQDAKHLHKYPWQAALDAVESRSEIADVAQGLG
jgi:hypothetical protein